MGGATRMADGEAETPHTPGSHAIQTNMLSTRINTSETMDMVDCPSV